MENIKEFFDRLAPNWNNEDNHYDIIDKLISRINITKNSDILDVGCGKGVITPRLYDKTLRIVDAIDLSDKMIEGAKIINDDPNKYNFICGNYFDYDFNKKYDYIIIFNAYPHFLDSRAVASKSYLLLRNGGKLVIMHDIARTDLNTHHKMHALNLSRPLKEPKEEFESFNDYFNLIDYIDNNDSYFVMMEKK